MAAPDIGTTVTEAYGRTLDRMGSMVSTIAVPAILSGIAFVVSSDIQSSVVGDRTPQQFLEDFQGGGLSMGELRRLGAAQAIMLLVPIATMLPALVVLAGCLHRDRHGADARWPNLLTAPGALVRAVVSSAPWSIRLLGLVALGMLLPVVVPSIGSIATIACAIAALVIWIRGAHVPAIAGAGEEVGAAAYERSRAATRGNWWRTFAALLVAQLAIGLPAIIVAAIVSAFVPGPEAVSAFSFLALFVLAFGLLVSGALESMWAQVEAATEPVAGDAPLEPGSPPAP